MSVSVLCVAAEADLVKVLGEVWLLVSSTRPPDQVVMVFDGCWPTHLPPVDPRVVLYHTGAVRGLQASYRAAAILATGSELYRYEDWQRYVESGILPQRTQPDEQTVTGDPRQIWTD